MKLNHEHAEVLDKIINDLGKIKKVETLYRASEYNFCAAAFHEKCDNKEHTLVLIRTEFGKTIGGYTHYPWESESEWLSDSGRRAFIFSLDMKEKFVPQGDEKLIGRYGSFGPTFGSSSDLYISDGCNFNDISRADFLKTYNRDGGKKLVSNQNNYRKFSGGNTSRFKVLEYEVFQVFFK